MDILVIDDDPAMIELLKLLLEPMAANITASTSGREGIDLVKTNTPDIVILDLMMPNIDGWQVCQSIREFSSVPILVLSALDSPGVVATALNAGADDYLIKPVPSGVLTVHINNLLKRSKPELKTATAAI
jgi:two-component system KDP operon response regulator KdpE